MRHENQSDFDCIVEACNRLLDENFAKSVDVKDDYVVIDISKKQMVILRQYFGDDSLDGHLPNEHYLEKVLTFHAHDVPVEVRRLTYVDGDIESYEVRALKLFESILKLRSH